MSKYIDAEKLTKFEETLADIIVSSQGLCTYEACKDVAKSEAPFLIASLQQEQPDVDIATEIEEHAGNMPHCEFSHYTEDEEDEEWAKKEFRYFYELGNNARK